MSIFSYIIWTASPDIFVIPGLNHPVRWYGLLFALGFIVSQQIMYYIFRTEKKPQKDIDTLTVHMVLATILGARLGHCLFYAPGYYLSNPVEILKIWEGGLASHGGAIGIFIAIYLYVFFDIKARFIPGLDKIIKIPYSWKITKLRREGQSFMWVVDRLVIVTALTGALIRTGNFMNSEIIGVPTESEFGVVFAREVTDRLTYSVKNLERVEVEKSKIRQSEGGHAVPVNVIFYFEKDYKGTEAQIKRLFDYQITDILQGPGKHIYADPEKPLSFDIHQKGGQFIVKTSALAIPRHPAQLYEAIYCIFLFLGLFHLWFHHRKQLPDGFMFGLFLTILWALRFVDEFFKENQEAFEDGLALNMGQLLSIPLFLFGLFILVRSLLKRKET